MPDILSNFQPRRRLLSDVTNDLNALVTTTEDHGYIVDQILRFFIPSEYGMTVEYEIATVLTVPSTDTFTVDLDTSLLEVYVTPTEPPSFTQAQVTPITGTTDNETSITGGT